MSSVSHNLFPHESGDVTDSSAGFALNKSSMNVGAINCTNDVSNTTKKIAGFIEAGLAEATRRAYRADLVDFRHWGATLPASDEEVAAYIADLAERAAVATISRRLAAISVAHEAMHAPNPVGSALVRATMRGIRRKRGLAQRQARPLLRDELFAVLQAIGDRPKDVRDRALLLLGFAGGFRRSELCKLEFEDLHAVQQGLIVKIRRSKTDQEGIGRELGIPIGRAHCPVAAIEQWTKTARIMSGPIFRPVDRHGHIGRGSLSGAAVSHIVRERVKAARLDPTGYSAHSLRSGLATAAAMAGVSTLSIQRQTGHTSDVTLKRYIRHGQLFHLNAAGALL